VRCRRRRRRREEEDTGRVDHGNMTSASQRDASSPSFLEASHKELKMCSK
jgi:hypothetical protein